MNNKMEYHTVGDLSQFPDGAATRVVVDGVAVAMVRVGDDFYALDDVCTHARVSLSDGEVWCRELELECPRHGSAFSLTTGAPNALPATQPVAVYPARVVDGAVQVAVSASQNDTPPTPEDSIR